MDSKGVSQVSKSIHPLNKYAHQAANPGYVWPADPSVKAPSHQGEAKVNGRAQWEYFYASFAATAPTAPPPEVAS